MIARQPRFFYEFCLSVRKKNMFSQSPAVFFDCDHDITYVAALLYHKIEGSNTLSSCRIHMEDAQKAEQWQNLATWLATDVRDKLSEHNEKHVYMVCTRGQSTLIELLHRFSKNDTSGLRIEDYLPDIEVRYFDHIAWFAGLLGKPLEKTHDPDCIVKAMIGKYFQSNGVEIESRSTLGVYNQVSKHVALYDAAGLKTREKAIIGCQPTLMIDSDSRCTVS